MPIKSAHRHADHRHPHAGRHQDLRRRPRRDRARSAREIEAAAAARCRGTRSVFAERAAGGYFLDFDWKRDELARYGLSDRRRADGGDERDRRRERHDDDRRARALSGQRALHAATSAATSSASAACWCRRRTGRRRSRWRSSRRSRLATGPSMIRNENGLLTGYVYVDRRRPRRRRLRRGSASALVARQVQLPRRLRARLERPVRGDGARPRAAARSCVPLTLAADRAAALPEHPLGRRRRSIVLLAVPFSAVGAFWLLYLLGYNMSIGVWVGLIALLGVDAETGVFMLLYLDLAYDAGAARGPAAQPRRICARRSSQGAVQAAAAEVHDRRRRCSWAWCRSCGRRARAPT